MAADEFCSGMHHDISAERDGLHQERCGKCVVYDQRDFMGVGNLRYSFHIYHLRAWISESLNKNSLCVLPDCALHFFLIKYIHKCSFNSIVRQCMLQQIIGAAVNVFCGDYVVALFCQVLECIGDGGCTRGNGKCRSTALQRRDPLFKDILGGIGQPAVNIACI